MSLQIHCVSSYKVKTMVPCEQLVLDHRISGKKWAKQDLFMASGRSYMGLLAEVLKVARIRWSGHFLLLY